ncbi:MAG: ATP-dependent helicase HrpB [Halomonadaceae bacterium]|nr:MAG: ATP-dependent helicase HrpB [Halomonadaceae bacterium]
MQPIAALIPDLLKHLSHHNTVLLQAPPGAGKTTVVPLALMADAPWAQTGRIVMLEPRRLAARSAARFMAAQLGEPLGERVGLRTRLETRVSPRTRIEVVTEGVLTRMLQKDPGLEGVALVIFDEFHERSLQADMGLALARESQQALREDLRLLIMSATLDADPLSQLLDNAPVLTSAGRSWPVTLSYHPPKRQQGLEDQVSRVIHQALAEQAGSLLVFLPGAGEIRRVQQRLTGQLPGDTDLCPLYGALKAEAQDRAISPASGGRRKVVLATAIAETSLTIAGITVVIDAGLERRPRFDPRSGMSRLVTERVSQAAAEQRRGRAGRLEPGHCYRLWSQSEQQGLPRHSPAAILSADLAPLALELAQWGSRDPGDLTWLDLPPAAHWEQAVDLLKWLDALDQEGAITAHGKAMNALGLPPRLAHMVIKGRQQGQGQLAAELAVLLSEQDLMAFTQSSDLRERLLLLRGQRQHPQVDRGRLQSLQQALSRLVTGSARGRPRDPVQPPEHGEQSTGELLALAFPDRVARRRPGIEPRYQLSNGRGARLADNDPLAGEPWLVAAELDGDRREARIYLAGPVTLAGLKQALTGHIRGQEESEWDQHRGTVMCYQRRRLGALILEEGPGTAPSAEQIEQALLAEVQRQGLQCLPWTPRARQWCGRVRLLHRLWPGQWPQVSEAALIDQLPQWLGPYLAGIRRWSGVQQLPLTEALNSLLDYPQQQSLKRLAPETLTLPGGHQAPLDYTVQGAEDAGPVLAIKLQGLFGCDATPTVADGQQPVTLHLLSPARRPLAVTSDLGSFWRQGYPQVCKECRGRYPKHPWPEDPLTATATLTVKNRQ